MESFDDGLNRAESKECDDLSDGFLVSAKVVKGNALAKGESLFASVTDEATFFDEVNAIVAFLNHRH